MSDAYQFRGERVEQLFRDATAEVTERDAEDTWEVLVDDGSGSAYVVTDDYLPFLAESIATLDPFDPRHSAEHAAALDGLEHHQHCARILSDLVEQRDDILAALLGARSYCFNDMYEGEFGNLYVSVELLLNELRPGLPDRGLYRGLDLVRDTDCHTCGARDYSHEDWCDAEDKDEVRAERRDSLIASHLYCADIGRTLIQHAARCLAQAEAIAHQARDNATTVYGDVVTDPHRVLAKFDLQALNLPLEPMSPSSLVAHVHPPLVDEDYCTPDSLWHHEPHRACRFLVS